MSLTGEILTEIRDGISKMETNLGGRIDALRTELKGELVELRGVVSQHRRIVDHALQVSLAPAPS